MYIIEKENVFEIMFRYSPLLVTKVKNLPGRRFDYVKKIWTVPLSYRQEVERFAKINNFNFKNRVQEPEPDYIIPPLPELNQEIPLKKNLFPFQRKGVAYALDKKRLIIGDQMGLGKTAQAIATITAGNVFPCLVICPASLKINWQREWAMWSNHKALILSDNNRMTFKLFHERGLSDVFIVNYESLRKYFVQDINRDKDGKFTLKDVTFNNNRDFFRSVIIDESHRVKSNKAQQTKFTKAICVNKEYAIAITGTPVVNKPADLITQLAIIGRLSDFGGYTGFMKRYCNDDESKNRKELNYLLNMRCFYRRDKSEVMKELPAKIRQKVICSIDNRQEYNSALYDLETYLIKYRQANDEQVERALRGEVIVRINVLKNISARGKLKDVFDFIDDVVESGEKLIVFGHLREVLGRVKDRYKGIAVSITGEDDPKSRQQALDSFQNNPSVRIVVCSIQAAGVGITLTAASRVAFIEMGWHPAIMDQAEDRAHRIGQTDSVQCSYFLGEDTIDEWVYDIIESKRIVSNEITGSTEQIEWSVIDNVINLFNSNNK